MFLKPQTLEEFATVQQCSGADIKDKIKEKESCMMKQLEKNLQRYLDMCIWMIQWNVYK